ncbi:MAG: hypothetical protein ABL864_11590 [Terricaulis sp.]
MTDLHTEQRDRLAALRHRLDSCEAIEKPEEWLRPKAVQSLDAIVKGDAEGLTAAAAKRWAKEIRRDQSAKAQALLQDALPALAALDAELVNGELRLKANGAVVIDSVFVDAKEAGQILVNWKLTAKAFSGQDRIEASELTDSLRKLRMTTNHALAKQVDDLADELRKTETSIHAKESALDALCYMLFHLTKADIALVEGG